MCSCARAYVQGSSAQPITVINGSSAVTSGMLYSTGSSAVTSGTVSGQWMNGSSGVTSGTVSVPLSSYSTVTYPVTVQSVQAVPVQSVPVQPVQYSQKVVEVLQFFSRPYVFLSSSFRFLLLISFQYCMYVCDILRPNTHVHEIQEMSVKQGEERKEGT